jgi:hypothetical protein
MITDEQMRKAWAAYCPKRRTNLDPATQAVSRLTKTIVPDIVRPISYQ